MYFSYFEPGRGELYFQALYNPFSVLLSEKIPELFMVGLNWSFASDIISSVEKSPEGMLWL